jgi:uncharacterized protein (UPF0335 family)
MICEHCGEEQSEFTIPVAGTRHVVKHSCVRALIHKITRLEMEVGLLRRDVRARATERWK